MVLKSWLTSDQSDEPRRKHPSVEREAYYLVENASQVLVSEAFLKILQGTEPTLMYREIVVLP